MAWINITTDEGELIERINTRGYDLSKAAARLDLMHTIREQVEIANQKRGDKDIKDLTKNTRELGEWCTCGHPHPRPHCVQLGCHA